MRSGFRLCNACSEPTVFTVRILLETKALEQSSQNLGRAHRAREKTGPRQALQYGLNLLNFLSAFQHTVGQQFQMHWMDIHQTYIRPVCRLIKRSNKFPNSSFATHRTFSYKGQKMKLKLFLRKHLQQFLTFKIL